MNNLRTDKAKSHLKGGFYSTREWRRIAHHVGIRDNHTCQLCDKYCPGRMEGVADHKIPRKRRPDLAYAMDNLWWLCQRCHNSTKKVMENNADKPQLAADGINNEWKI